MLLSIKVSLPVTTTPLFSQTSTVHSFQIKLLKQTKKRFQVKQFVLIFILSGTLGLYYYYNQLMLSQQSSIFPKQIKIDDYAPYQDGNVLCILQSSNLLLGTGARTSHTAIVLAKTLHYLAEQGVLKLNNKSILQLGCGVGLVGIYLACLGNKVMLCDLSTMKDLVVRNIGINKSVIKGKAQFIIANWKNSGCLNKCEELNEGNSTTSSEKPECLTHLMESIDYTICCQCGGLTQLQFQLKFMGKEGFFLAFTQKEQYFKEESLNQRMVEEYLIEHQINYQKIDQFHPDYSDQRIGIYHIWK